MKTFFNFTRSYFFFISLATLGLLSSCGDEVTPAAPTVSIEQGTNSSAYPGDTVTLNATVNANAPLAEVNVFLDQANIANYPSLTGFQQFTVPEVEYIILQSDAGQTVRFTFEARDENDKVGEATHSVQVFAETPLAYDSVGAILGNRIGNDPSAWSLVDNVRLGKDADGADMQNPSIADGTVEQQWIKGWDGESGTIFVKSNAFDYENATIESATAAFAEGTAVAQVREVEVGDIYIANMRSGGEYAVIRVTSVSENIPNDNPEEIIFDYKKATATSGQ